MGRGLVYGMFFMMASAAFGASYTGRLVDARCAEQRPEASCNPTAATSHFALVSSGKLLKLDSDGNAKAAQALARRNDRTNEEKLPDVASGVDAIVQGEVNGYQIMVRDIEIQ